MKLKILIFFIMFSVTFSQDWEGYKKETLSKLKSISGWCSFEKAEKMMDLIYETKPEACVEIGVFAGASIFPTARALKYLDSGVVHAIDSWNTYEAIRYFPKNDPNYIWWKKIDMNGIYLSFCRLISKYRLNKHCYIIKKTAESSSYEFKTIDILHIDGNPCDESVYINVTKYIPKVKIGGYIWFNGWSYANKSFEYVKKTCYVVKVIDGGSCILLKKIFED